MANMFLRTRRWGGGEKKSPILASLEKWADLAALGRIPAWKLGWCQRAVVAIVATTPNCLSHEGVSVSCWFSSWREL